MSFVGGPPIPLQLQRLMQIVAIQKAPEPIWNPFLPYDLEVGIKRFAKPAQRCAVESAASFVRRPANHGEPHIARGCLWCLALLSHI
jgi:hypothetical protein